MGLNGASRAAVARVFFCRGAPSLFFDPSVNRDNTKKNINPDLFLLVPNHKKQKDRILFKAASSAMAASRSRDGEKITEWNDEEIMEDVDERDWRIGMFTSANLPRTRDFDAFLNTYLSDMTTMHVAVHTDPTVRRLWLQQFASLFNLYTDNDLSNGTWTWNRQHISRELRKGGGALRNFLVFCFWLELALQQEDTSGTALGSVLGEAIADIGASGDRESEATLQSVFGRLQRKGSDANDSASAAAAAARALVLARGDVSVAARTLA